MRRILVVLALMVLSSRTVAAQDDAITYGTHIRIQADDERNVREGAFRSLTSDSISFSPGLDTSTQTLPLARVKRIEVSRGMSSTGSTFKGAAIGAAAGAVVVGAMAMRCHDSGSADCGIGVALTSPLRRRWTPRWHPDRTRIPQREMVARLSARP
jgi:hypothetical protein